MLLGSFDFSLHHVLCVSYYSHAGRGHTYPTRSISPRYQIEEGILFFFPAFREKGKGVFGFFKTKKKKDLLRTSQESRCCCCAASESFQAGQMEYIFKSTLTSK